jgi:hypothetical protein
LGIGKVLCELTFDLYSLVSYTMKETKRERVKERNGKRVGERERERKV